MTTSNTPDEPASAEIIRELEEHGAQAPPWASQTTGWFLEQYPRLAAVDISDIPIAGPHGDVPARLYRGPEESGQGLVWVHGGAFITGDLDMPEANWVALELAARGTPVLSVDYRKALHGIAHPIPSDDVLSAWQEATARSHELFGVSPTRVHLGGASAGANITAGLSIRLRDGAGPMPGSLVLVYPLVHAKLPVPSPAAAAAAGTLAPEQRYPRQDVDWLNLHYVGGDPATLADPAAFAGGADLAGLSPVYIIVSERDDLRPSGELYAVQLWEAGVHVHLDIEDGAAHGHLNEPGLPEAHRSLARIADWIIRLHPDAA